MDLHRTTFRLIGMMAIAAFCKAPAYDSLAEDLEGDMLPLRCTFSQYERVYRARGVTVTWEGREYFGREAAQVLMEVITDSGTDSARRGRALEKLGRLRNRDLMERLIALYTDMNEREEKIGILLCLNWSQDPRGLRLFAEVLDQEKDNYLRMLAAGSLAEWNIRMGVAELIALMDRTENVGGRTIGENALISIQIGNRRGEWGYPEKQVIESAERLGDMPPEERRAIHLEAISDWWAENKQRFPEWRPGDPLPPAPLQPPLPPGPTDKLPLDARFNQADRVWGDQACDEPITWKAQEGKTWAGVEPLLSFALTSENENERVRALKNLEFRGRCFRGTPFIAELIDHYEKVEGRVERPLVLFILARSQDPRGLPLFVNVLETSDEPYLRLPAALGLALWNERSGVHELIELVLVERTEGNHVWYHGRIAEMAVSYLVRLNAWKWWWGPEDSLRTASEHLRGDDRGDVQQRNYRELMGWFRRNAHRFPEWNPGDPLPVSSGKNVAQSTVNHD